HFVEINFGIAIASTRTTFWAYAGILIVAGLNLIQEPDATPLHPAEQVSNARRRGRRQRTTSTQSDPTDIVVWLGPTLAVALLGGFILGTLTFDFVTNAERLSDPLRIVWRALTALPGRSASNCTALWDPLRGDCRSYGGLMITGLTWLLSATIFISTLIHNKAFENHKNDVALATVIYLTASLVVGLGFALFLAGRQAAMMDFQARSIQDVIAIADRIAKFMTAYYWFIVLTLLAASAMLLIGDRQDIKETIRPWGAIGLITLSILGVAVIIATNLRPIQADMIYKQADPYERQGQWLVAIEHYKRAIEVAPREDFYYLYLGRAYLEYAASLEDTNVRDAVMRETEQTLIRAREINPLNTDHSANLARMYRRWADLTEAGELRDTLVRKASENYALATSLSPHNPILWNEWAMLYYYAMGDMESYQRTFQHSLEIDPEFEQTWLMCGDVNRHSGNLEEAVSCYNEALTLRRVDELQVLLALGETYRAMERWDDAISALTEALEVSPGSGNTLRILADTYITAQRWDDAIATLLRLTAVDSSASDIWNIYSVLAQLFAQSGQNDQALIYAQQALASAPAEQQASIESLIAQLQSMDTLDQ
ncbi:MAG: tetratricopeptide repeat protein, partial [Chloroflexi bacterium]|nr:tetratricopeptide repeat protein [Chloroflexota bacterium]